MKAAPSCRSLFREAPQGYFSQIDDGQLIFTSTANSNRSNGKRARVDYSFNSETQTLLIEWVHVDPSLRELGIANHMIKEIVDRYPEVKQVIGYLTDKNLQIYEVSLKAFKSSDLALKATPYFKSFESLGFSEVITNEYFDEKVAVALQRPQSMP